MPIRLRSLEAQGSLAAVKVPERKARATMGYGPHVGSALARLLRDLSIEAVVILVREAVKSEHS